MLWQTHPYKLLLLGLNKVMFWRSAIIVSWEPTEISQLMVCDIAEFFISTSFAAEIVSVDTWDFSVGSKTPSSRVYPPVPIVGRVQITWLICAGISERIQLIMWLLTVYTFVASVSMVTTETVIGFTYESLKLVLRLCHRARRKLKIMPHVRKMIECVRNLLKQ